MSSTALALSIYSSLSSSSLVPLLLSSSINICILIRLCSPCFPTICMCHVACCFLVISVYIMSRFCSNVVCVLCHIALTLYLNLCCFQALEKVNRQMSHYTQFFFLKAYLNLFHSCIGIRLKYYLSFYCFRVISFIISFYILPHHCCGFSQSLLVQRMGETLKSGNEIRI